MATTRVALVAVLCLVTACASERVNTMSFASMREARQAGAVERGWVPPMFPDGAYELRAAYEPGGWRRWGILNFRADDAAALRAITDEGTISLEGMHVDIPGRIEWWPLALRGDLNAESLAITGMTGHRIRGTQLVLAVNWSQGRAYYWATGN